MSTENVRFANTADMRAAAAKATITEVGGALWAYKIEGLDPQFASQPFGRQMEGFDLIKKWKVGAKSAWISTKPRAGQKPGPQLRKWLKDVNPREFFAKWDLRVDDDVREIFYK